MTCHSCTEWHEVANDLAAALRPYTMFREQMLKEGRLVVETAVPAVTLSNAHAALERFAEHVYMEQHKRTQERSRLRKAA